MKTPNQITDEKVLSKIYHLRGKKIMIDRDLSEMYGVETRRLNEQVKRNLKRFPEDFMFQLTQLEFENWLSQIAISNSGKMGLRKRPFAFTEQGVAMLSSVLKSDTAIAVNIQIIRIFTRLRELILTQKDVLLKMEKLERKHIKQNKKISKHDKEIQVIFDALKKLLNAPKPRTPIGFNKLLS